MHSIQCSFALKDLAEKHSEGTRNVNLTTSLMMEAREDVMSWDPASKKRPSMIIHGQIILI